MIGQQNGKVVNVEGINVYVSMPTQRDNKNSVLLIHEYWGLNDQTKKWADACAELGYQAAAIDLFDGKVTADPKAAERQMEEADPKECLRKLETVLDWMPSRDGLQSQKTVTIGWCFGGGYSLQCALKRGDKLAGSVIYYGSLETDARKLAGCNVPLFGIFARTDKWITLGMVNKFEHACREAKVPHEVHIYDADHAFANPAKPSYNAGLAKDAWEKTAAFLKRVMP